MNIHERINFCEWMSLLTLYVWTISNFIPAVNTMALWVLVPFSFVCCIWKYPRMVLNRYMLILFCLYAWLTLLLPIAGHYDAAIKHISRIWGTYCVCFMTMCLGQKRSTFTLAIFSWIVLLLVLFGYAQTHIMETLDITKRRMQDGNINANTFAYVLLICTAVTYYLGDMKGSRWRTFWRWTLIALIPIAWYISLLAASRQIILLIIPYIALLILRRYFSFNVRNILLTLVIAFSCVGAYMEWGAKKYEGSYLASRMSIKVEDDSRARLIRESLHVFLDNPVAGIGPDQFRFRSYEGAGAHNTFLELLADSGIPGCAIYLALLITFIGRNYRRWRALHSDMFFAMTAYGAAFFLQNFFYIFHGAPQLFGFFFLVASYSDNLWDGLRTGHSNPRVIAAAHEMQILPMNQTDVAKAEKK